MLSRNWGGGGGRKIPASTVICQFSQFMENCKRFQMFSDILNAHLIFTFLLFQHETEEEREIKQFHFTVWPDHGVPEYPTAILAFQRRVRAYSTRDAGPLVVHCR